MHRLAIVIAVSSLTGLVGCGARPDGTNGVGSATNPLTVRFSDDVRVGGSLAPEGFKLQMQGAAIPADPTYRTSWTIAPGGCLRVLPRSGDAVVISGSPMVADFYHVGHILGVAIGPQDSQHLYAFYEPVSWETTTCPAAK